MANIKQHIVFTCQRAYNLLTLACKSMWSCFYNDNGQGKSIVYVEYNLYLIWSYILISSAFLLIFVLSDPLDILWQTKYNKAYLKESSFTLQELMESQFAFSDY